MGMHPESDQNVPDDQGDDAPSDNAHNPGWKIGPRDIKNGVTSGQRQGQEYQEGAEDAEGSSRFHSGEYKLVHDADETYPMVDSPTGRLSPLWVGPRGPAPGDGLL